jgi:hypothetical protein
LCLFIHYVFFFDFKHSNFKYTGIGCTFLMQCNSDTICYFESKHLWILNYYVDFLEMIFHVLIDSIQFERKWQVITYNWKQWNVKKKKLFVLQQFSSYIEIIEQKKTYFCIKNKNVSSYFSIDMLQKIFSTRACFEKNALFTACG